MSDRRDLSEFTELNKTKVPFAERLALIYRIFPSVEHLDWVKIWKDDPTLLGELINDLLKLDQAVPGRPGKRSAVDPAIARERLKFLQGDDYTEVMFPESLKVLMGDHSIRQTATRTGINRNTIYDYLHEKKLPDFYAFELLASAFKKDPSYFPEYRNAWIVSAVLFRLERRPEASVHFYRKLRQIGRHGVGQ